MTKMGKNNNNGLGSTAVIDKFNEWWKNVNLQEREVIARCVDINDIDSLIYTVAYQSWLDGFFTGFDSAGNNNKQDESFYQGNSDCPNFGPR